MTSERDLTRTLAGFEGLVRSTARMFAGQVGRDPEDLAQELRVRCWRAIASYDPARSTQSLQRYVFSAVANKVKDFKRDAAREAARRERHGLSFTHIEDTLVHDGRLSPAERFDQLHHHVGAEEVYAAVEAQRFECPASVSAAERRVLVALMCGASRAEVARLLGLSRGRVDEIVRTLRVKLADWRPSQLPQVEEQARARAAEQSRRPAQRAAALAQPA